MLKTDLTSYDRPGHRIVLRKFRKYGGMPVDKQSEEVELVAPPESYRW